MFLVESKEMYVGGTNLSLRDLLNESLREGRVIPFSSWKTSWKEKYVPDNSAATPAGKKKDIT